MVGKELCEVESDVVEVLKDRHHNLLLPFEQDAGSEWKTPSLQKKKRVTKQEVG